MVQVTYESGPEKRERLLREYVERRRHEDPEGWARRVKVEAQIVREAEDCRAVWGLSYGRGRKDLGPSRGYTVPAHGGLVGQDVFATERRVVRRII